MHALSVSIWQVLHAGRSLVFAILVIHITGSSCEVCARPPALTRAHAHNDYAQPRPLLDAIDNGFCSVEADIFLVDGQLLVAHTPAEIRPDRTLAGLYLEPLSHRVRANRGHVYPDVSLILLVDIKSEADATYARLHEELEKFAHMLSSFQHGEYRAGAVTVVVSGNRPRDLLAKQSLRWAGFDGRLEDLSSELPVHLMPLISDRWTDYFQWNGDGEMPAMERLQLRRIVQAAHGRGRKIRFWDTPEKLSVWQELLQAQVDLINTDDLVALRRYLTQDKDNAYSVQESLHLWRREVVFEGGSCMTAVAADFTNDGIVDVIADTGNGICQLFAGPNWHHTIIDDDHQGQFIHSEHFDVDQDGDEDYIGARYNPGLILWFENPGVHGKRWVRRVVDDQIHGIHGLLKADLDGDGQFELLANSAQPKPPFPESLAWLQPPTVSGSKWRRFILADQDAPGLTHYLGAGDVNDDGRLDVATGAKGGPSAPPHSGDWFAWWEAPLALERPWRKQLIARNQPGATNIHPADVNGDGSMDFIATRGHGYGVIWFEGPSWQLHEIHPTIKEPHCLVVTDMDQDGDVDCATCAFGDELCAWFENDGTGRFQTHVVGQRQQAYDIRTVDKDQDGDLDLLVAGRQSQNVVWFVNPGTAQEQR